MKQPPKPDAIDQPEHHLRDDAEDRFSDPERTFSDLSGKSSKEIIHETQGSANRTRTAK